MKKGDAVTTKDGRKGKILSVDGDTVRIGRPAGDGVYVVKKSDLAGKKAPTKKKKAPAKKKG